MLLYGLFKVLHDEIRSFVYSAMLNVTGDAGKLSVVVLLAFLKKLALIEHATSAGVVILFIIELDSKRLFFVLLQVQAHSTHAS